MYREPIFLKYESIKYFFSSHDYSSERFRYLYGININDLDISSLERTVLISGIKSYLKQNKYEFSDDTLRELNIHGIARDELIAAPNFRCGINQTTQSPQCMSIEHHIIQSILSGSMTFSGIDSGKYLSKLLSGESSDLSKEGSKLLGKAVLQEPNLILRITCDLGEYGKNIFKSITQTHIIHSLKSNPELQENYIFKIFNVENLEDLFNAVGREIFQKSRKEVDKFFLEMAVNILKKTRKISDSFIITTNTKNDRKVVSLPYDINRNLCDYFTAQDIISLIEAGESPNLIHDPSCRSHDSKQLKQQMSTLGLDDQAGSSSILSVGPVMDCHVNLGAETRRFS